LISSSDIGLFQEKCNLSKQYDTVIISNGQIQCEILSHCWLHIYSVWGRSPFHLLYPRIWILLYLPWAITDTPNLISISIANKADFFWM
jgi:hypothetical protein